MESKKYFGLDAVRVMAFVLLLWLHFLLRNGFYSQPVDSVPMMLAAAGRCVFMCCIPLFLMLTGYLKCGKEWKKGYYHSLPPMLVTWVIVSLICLWYKISVAGQEKTAVQWITEFFDFKLANYSWYIEMYIGLLLVSPFLNAAWVHLEAKRQRQAMVLTFVILTFLPATVDGIQLGEDAVLNLLPNYWTNLYFFTYYLMGCYIRTYEPKLKPWQALAGAAAIALFMGMANRYTGGAETNFYGGYNISYNHLGTVGISVLLFLGVYHLDCRREWLQKGMRLVSSVTLEMYLISCVFDQQIYVFQKGQYGAEEYLWRGLLSTGAVFLLSLAAGWCIHQVSAWMCRWPSALFHR